MKREIDFYQKRLTTFLPLFHKTVLVYLTASRKQNREKTISSPSDSALVLYVVAPAINPPGPVDCEDFVECTSCDELPQPGSYASTRKPRTARVPAAITCHVLC